MKFFIALILTALLSYAAGFYFPWWSIAIIAFAIAFFIPQKPFHSFLSAFLSLFLLWGILALIIDVNNDHLLSEKISQVFFKVKSHAVIILITGFVAGLTGGFAALSASYLHKKKKEY